MIPKGQSVSSYIQFSLVTVLGPIGPPVGRIEDSF